MNVILHITQRQQWDEAKLSCAYRSDTLEYEGFIHCSTPLQVIQVANRFFPNQKGLVLLCIDSDRVKAEIKYEGWETQELFPHIYGELNLDAVFEVLDFEPNSNGKFDLPKQLADVI